MNLKFFAGPLDSANPELMLKSDAAKELTGAAAELGWHSIPSLENRWPHNAVHERWHATFKSVLRAALLQSGFPERAWDLAVTYSSTALAITQRAPLLPSERDASGQVLESCADKACSSCWEIHNGGDPFGGPIQPFGRLIFLSQ